MLLSNLGLSPIKVKQFEKKNIFTDEDLLKFYPRKYMDFRNESDVTFENVDKEIVIKGTVKLCNVFGTNNIVKCVVRSSNGIDVDVLWFNQPYMYEKIQYWINTKVAVCGKLKRDSFKYKNFTIINPVFFTQSISDVMKIFPVYSKIAGMSEDFVKGTIAKILKSKTYSDYLGEGVRKSFKLCDYKDLFQKIHNPKDENDINESKRRLIFDDMFYFASRLIAESNQIETSDFVVKNFEKTKKVIEQLPFKLTEDQKNVFGDIFKSCKNGERLNGLVQGDVGSGKTIVAFLTMVLFAENGYQSVLMAPTQVLANQHYNDLVKLIEPFGFKAVILKSKMKVKEKREALSAIASGDANFIIGTHSVFSEDVVYNNLALTITDEEHKFGVAQREAITEKASEGVHSISMSATPIPRTLAMTLYGANKKVFTISQMPAGRKPVITSVETEEEKIFGFLKKQIDEGRQGYIVCPLITKSDSERFEDVEAVEDVFKRVKDYFGSYKINAAVVTGNTKPDELKEILSDFKENKIQILVSTTIIEVGVNIPNASTIIIKNAERFGLAQLHQLRGRVGRGDYQGYCILQPQESLLLYNEGEQERLNVMCQTNNGFEVAEADLKFRGCGDLIGTQQSGDNKYVQLMLLYPKFFNKVKEFAESQMKINNHLTKKMK